jgi:TP901 family phage tail tape measure protein
MEKVGLQFIAEGASEFIRQFQSAQKTVLEFANSTVGAAGNLKAFNSAADATTQAITALKTRQTEIIQTSTQLKTVQAETTATLASYRNAQSETVQTTSQLKSAQTEEVQELNKLKSAQTEVAQTSAQLKTAQTEEKQSTTQLGAAQTETATELSRLRTAKTENVQASTQLKNAQTEEKQATTQLKTAQAEATTELGKLRTAQTENVQVATQVKTAQIGEVQAATELKQAQAGAVTELGKLRIAQTENVTVATQVKTAQIGEAQAATQLKTAQASAASELAKLRSEQSQAVKSTTEVKTANLALDGQLKQTRLSILQQKQAQMEAGESASGFGSILAGIGPKGMIAAAAAVGISKSVITMAGDFDASMAKVQVATGISDRQSEAFKRLEEAARTVGGSTKFSATEAAEGLATLAQAGLDANQSISALPAVAKAAEVNQVSMGEAAKTVTVAMNAFGLSASDATKIIDVQTTAAAAGVLDFNDFQGAIASVGSVAKSAGQDLEGSTAAIIAMTNAGQSATDAGTSLKSALQHLQNPSKDARASMDELGLSVYDANGNMRPFSDIIAQIEQKTKDLLPVQKDQILANIFQSDGIKAVTSSMGAHIDVMRDGKKVTLEGSEALKEWERQLKNSAGSTDKAASVLNTTFNAKLEKMIGNIEDAAIGIGTKLLPQISGLVDTFSSIVDKVAGLEDATHILTTMASISFTPLTEGLKLINRELGNITGEGKSTIQTFTDLGKSTNSFQAPNLNQATSNMYAFRQSADSGSTSVKQMADSIATVTSKALATQNIANYTDHLDFLAKRANDGVVWLEKLPTPLTNLDPLLANLSKTSGILGNQLASVNNEISRLRDETGKASQQMSEASGQVKTVDDAVSWI